MSERDPHDSPFPTPELDTQLSRGEPAPAPRRAPRTLFAVVAATVLVVGATFTAVALRSSSGDGDGDGDGGAAAPAPASDWRSDVEEICFDAAARAEPLVGDPSLAARRRFVTLGLETVARLREEPPPAAIAADVEFVLDRWQGVFVRLDRAVARADAARYDAALERAAAELEAVNGVAEAIGFGVCATQVFSPHWNA
jgi:hypothetical protein